MRRGIRPPLGLKPLPASPDLTNNTPDKTTKSRGHFMKTQLTMAAITLSLLQCPLGAVDGQDKPPSIQARHTDEFQDLIRQFREQNADYIQARRDLRQRLAATYDPAERRALIRAFIEEHMDQIQAQRDLRKAFRQAHMEIRRHRRGERNGAQN